MSGIIQNIISEIIPPFYFNLSTGTNTDLRTAAIAAGWDLTGAVIATLPISTYIGSTSTGAAALTISGSFPNGVAFINSGVIVGRGGNGGAGGQTAGAGGSAGTAGGLAMNVSVSCSIDNLGTIGGGGQGGTGGAAGSIVGISMPKGGTGGAGIGGGIGGNNNAAGNGNYNPPTAGTGSAGTTGSNGSTGATGGTGGGYGSGACLTGNTNITWVTLGVRSGAIS